MVTVESKFIGDFKIGDNINHNLEVLSLLYRHYAVGNQRDRRLAALQADHNPPGVESIIDAVLHDLRTRIRDFTIEGVQNIVAASLDRIRRLKKMDKLL